MKLDLCIYPNLNLNVLSDNCHYFVWEHEAEKMDLLIWKQEKETFLTEIESLRADLKRTKEDKKMLEEKMPN